VWLVTQATRQRETGRQTHGRAVGQTPKAGQKETAGQAGGAAAAVRRSRDRSTPPRRSVSAGSSRPPPPRKVHPREVCRRRTPGSAPPDRTGPSLGDLGRRNRPSASRSVRAPVSARLCSAGRALCRARVEQRPMLALHAALPRGRLARSCAASGSARERLRGVAGALASSLAGTRLQITSGAQSAGNERGRVRHRRSQRADLQRAPPSTCGSAYPPPSRSSCLSSHYFK